MSSPLYPVTFPGAAAEPPAGPEALAAAARQSLTLLSVLPRRVGAVLAGIAYRAVGGAPYAGPSPLVVLTGPPGCGKTTCGAAALSHFSPDTGMHPLWRSSAMEAAGASLAYDVQRARGCGLAMIDVPALGQTVLMTADGPETGPEAMEALTVSLGPHEVTAPARAALAAREAPEGRAALGAAFAAWLAGEDPGLLTGRKTSLAARFAGEWRDEGHRPSAARVLAELSAGWDLMLSYLEHAGACPADVARQLRQQARAGLHEAGLAHARELR